MRRPSLPVVLALAGAALLAALASGEPFAPRLVRLEAASAVPEMADLLAREPLTVSAVMLQYADEAELRLNAHLALRRHPRLAGEILTLYGGEPEFRQVLAAHGPAVIPPIAYFMRHEMPSLDVMRAAGEAIAGARRVALRLLGVAGNDGPVAPASGEPPPESGELAAYERGWYAIAFIRDEGHDFLGQFVVDAGGQVARVQTERITEAAAEFFTGGIRALETRYRRDEEPRASDFLWAGVDVALGAGTVKVLRLGRLAGTGAKATRASVRGSLAARALLRGGRTALRAGRYGVPVAVAYALVRHPSLISGLAAQAARLAGWPVAAVQAAVWFLVLLPLLLLARLVTRWLVRPAVRVLRALTRGAIALERAARGSRPGRRKQRTEPRIGDLTRPAGPQLESAPGPLRHGRGVAPPP